MEVTDALTSYWPRCLIYTLLPILILPNSIQKIKEQQVEVLTVAPTSSNHMAVEQDRFLRLGYSSPVTNTLLAFQKSIQYIMHHAWPFIDDVSESL